MQFSAVFVVWLFVLLTRLYAFIVTVQEEYSNMVVSDKSRFLKNLSFHLKKDDVGSPCGYKDKLDCVIRPA